MTSAPAMSFRANVDALARQFIQDFRGRDAEACAAAYAVGARKFNPGGKLLEGRAAIAQDLTELFETTDLTITDAAVLDCAADGGIGFAVVRLSAGAESFVVMLGLRREASGLWLISHEVING